jgi:hypothetical protein
MKRLVRTRMLGVVRGVPGNRAPISIAMVRRALGQPVAVSQAVDVHGQSILQRWPKQFISRLIVPQSRPLHDSSPRTWQTQPQQPVNANDQLRSSER